MIENQTVVGRWYITGHDSRTDADALPERIPLSGRVVFTPKGSDVDGIKWVRVPAEGDRPSYRLAIRPVAVPVMDGILRDDDGDPGVQLPAVAGGEPIWWVAKPELFEDPGRGRAAGASVAVWEIPFGPAEPNEQGVRVVDLALVTER